MEPPPKVLIVDDTPQNLRVLDAVLAPRGYTVIVAASGAEALAKVAEERPDIVLLDVVMPGMDGYEVCRRLRADPATSFLPVVMVTASGDEEKSRALDVGADDFIPKPFNQPELLARVRSLLRIKTYHDTIQAQTAELARWNSALEERVTEQVEELERLGRLRRVVSPQLANTILSAGGEGLLESHRRDIAVLFCDLRGFTAFSELAEPEEVMGVLGEYHEAVGELIFEFEGTVGHFAGDGLMVFFNDPLPCPDPSTRAVRMAVAMRDRMADLTDAWRKRGHNLGFGVGVAQGYATMGRIGFEGRYDYGAIGTVLNLASRLCDEAEAGQILISQRVLSAVEGLANTEPLGERSLKGFHTPVAAYNVVGVTSP